MKIPFLCAVGLHDWQSRHVWLTSFYAPTITEVRFSSVCARCKKEHVGLHQKWNEEKQEMVDVRVEA